MNFFIVQNSCSSFIFVSYFIFRGNSILKDFIVHETAIVDQGAVIGTGSRIWHWVHVCGGANIGTSRGASAVSQPHASGIGREALGGYDL